MFCNNCGSKIPDTAKFCQNCGSEIIKEENNNYEEMISNVEIQKEEDNNICFLESKKAICGFSQGELYAYNNRLEYINKKGIKTIYYFNEIKDFSTLGKAFTLMSKTGKAYSFGVIDGDAYEWIKFVKYRIEKEQQQYMTMNSKHFDTINELIDLMKANRIEVVKAFSNETGMSLTESKKLVDEVYEERTKRDATLNPFVKKAIEKREEKEMVEQLKKDKIPYCPKCHSTSLSANKKGFGFVKGALGMGLTGGVDIGMIVGGAGANKIMLTCMNCGHKFKPRKK